MLNVPARSDKLDAMKLTASLTDFDFDIIEGINGLEVPKKALSGVRNTQNYLLSLKKLTMSPRSGRRMTALEAG